MLVSMHYDFLGLNTIPGTICKLMGTPQCPEEDNDFKMGFL